MQLLSAILLHLRDPADLLAAALTSKRMRDIVKDAPLKLHISNKQLDPPSHSFLRNPSRLFPGAHICLLSTRSAAFQSSCGV